MTYKKENLMFLNMELHSKKGNCSYRDNPEIFDIEYKLTVEEKIKFIDDLEDGVATYLLDLFKKWEDEKESLPKDKYGSTKTVSKKSWIKRNDSRNIVCCDGTRIGSYYMFSQHHKFIGVECLMTEYGRNLAYTGEHVANQWFHDLCCKFRYEESLYFKSIDEFEIKLSQVVSFGNKHHTCFNSQDLMDIVWNRRRDVTIEQLDTYISAYERLEEFINGISLELKESGDESQ